MRHFYNWVIIVVVAFAFASCGTQKNLTFLQDMEYGVPYEVLPMQEIHLQPGDQISIVVSCKQPELAITFNIMSGSINVDGTAVPVHGLGSAAYEASTAFATAAQGTKADMSDRRSAPFS